MENREYQLITDRALLYCGKCKQRIFVTEVSDKELIKDIMSERKENENCYIASIQCDCDQTGKKIIIPIDKPLIANVNPHK